MKNKKHCCKSFVKISAVAKQLKSTIKLVANVINMYVTFNLLMVLEKQTFVLKLTFYLAPATNQIKQFRQSLIKCGELFNKHLCKNKILLSKETVEISKL